MYDNITEDNEYEEVIYVVMLCRMYVHVYRLIGTIRWSNNVLMEAILNFRELFGLIYMTL